MAYPTYSVAADTANASVKHADLQSEIKALSLAATDFEGISCAGDVLTIHFTSTPSGADQTAVDGAVAAHTGHDALADAKKAKIAAIDRRTGELIDVGFTYASKQFSLSIASQSKMTAAHQIRNEGAFVYPVVWNSIDDSETYSILDATDMGSFYMTAIGTIRAHLDSGTGLKDSVRAAAADIAAVDAVVDNR